MQLLVLQAQVEHLKAQVARRQAMQKQEGLQQGTPVQGAPRGAVAIPYDTPPDDLLPLQLGPMAATAGAAQGIGEKYSLSGVCEWRAQGGRDARQPRPAAPRRGNDTTASEQPVGDLDSAVADGDVLLDDTGAVGLDADFAAEFVARAFLIKGNQLASQASGAQSGSERPLPSGEEGRAPADSFEHHAEVACTQREEEELVLDSDEEQQLLMKWEDTAVDLSGLGASDRPAAGDDQGLRHLSQSGQSHQSPSASNPRCSSLGRGRLIEEAVGTSAWEPSCRGKENLQPGPSCQAGTVVGARDMARPLAAKRAQELQDAHDLQWYSQASDTRPRPRKQLKRICNQAADASLAHLSPFPASREEEADLDSLAAALGFAGVADDALQPPLQRAWCQDVQPPPEDELICLSSGSQGHSPLRRLQADEAADKRCFGDGAAHAAQHLQQEDSQHSASVHRSGRSWDASSLQQQAMAGPPCQISATCFQRHGLQHVQVQCSSVLTGDQTDDSAVRFAGTGAVHAVMLAKAWC
jgi:hypothetical protein